MTDYPNDLRRYRELGKQLSDARDLSVAERIAEQIAKLLRRGGGTVDAIGGPMPDRPRPLHNAIEAVHRPTIKVSHHR